MVELEIRKQNRELIKRYKTKCKICGESDPCCLEFHHVNHKNFRISWGITNKNTEDLEKELKLCICVCCNCHHKIHNKKGEE